MLYCIYHSFAVSSTAFCSGADTLERSQVTIVVKIIFATILLTSGTLFYYLTSIV